MVVGLAMIGLRNRREHRIEMGRHLGVAGIGIEVDHTKARSTAWATLVRGGRLEHPEQGVRL